jgi:hypothetical protein
VIVGRIGGARSPVTSGNFDDNVQIWMHPAVNNSRAPRTGLAEFVSSAVGARIKRNSHIWHLLESGVDARDVYALANHGQLFQVVDGTRQGPMNLNFTPTSTSEWGVQPE